MTKYTRRDLVIIAGTIMHENMTVIHISWLAYIITCSYKLIFLPMFMPSHFLLVNDEGDQTVPRPG